MGKSRKPGKPKSNRANVVKNLKRILQNSDLLNRMKQLQEEQKS
jgi:hypothetical protein